FTVVLVAAAAAGTVGALDVAAVAIDVEDLAGVVGVLVGDFEDRPGGDAAAAVGIGNVAADGLVQRAAQLVGAGVVDQAVVVATATATAARTLHVEVDDGVGLGRSVVEIEDEAGVNPQRAGLARHQRTRRRQGEAGRLRDVIQPGCAMA